MTETHIIIEIEGRDVDSRLTHQPTPGSQDLVRITSICDGQVHSATVAVSHRAGYTPEQAEYDIEQARWASAQAAAGKAHVRALLPSILITEPASHPRRVTAPEHTKPNPTVQSNTGTK